jgi:hypothetical protein
MLFLSRADIPTFNIRLVAQRVVDRSGSVGGILAI